MSDRGGSTVLEVTLAMLLGGAIGASLALLYAPAPGEETRRRLKETAGKLKKQLEERCETASEYISETKDKVREFIEEKKGDVTAAYEAGREAYKREKAKL